MIKKIMITTAILAAMACGAHAEPKFVFRYASSGLVSAKIAKPTEPTTPVEFEWAKVEFKPSVSTSTRIEMLREPGLEQDTAYFVTTFSMSLRIENTNDLATDVNVFGEETIISFMSGDMVPGRDIFGKNSSPYLSCEKTRLAAKDATKCIGSSEIWIRIDSDISSANYVYKVAHSQSGHLSEVPLNVAL